jgi:hypothetical protein
MAEASRLVRALPVLAVLGFLVSAGCRDTDAPCTRSPLGEVTVFLEGESGVATFAGTVEAIGTRSDLGLRSYRIRDEAGGIRTLMFGALEDSLPVSVGTTYEFEVATIPGMPTPNALQILEEGRFLFGAASDFTPGDRVFEVPPAGFQIFMERADCADRGVNPCYTSEVNGQLVCSRKGETARLFQGESAVVDGVRVTCLTARFLEYSDACADAGAFGVSYVMGVVDP